MTFRPGIYDESVEPGTTWERVITFLDMDVSAHVWMGEVRLRPGTDVIVELSTSAGNVSAVYSAPDTIMTIRLEAAETDVLVPNRARWWMNSDDGTDVQPWWSGDFTIADWAGVIPP